MPECNCGAFVKEGMKCPQCGSTRYGKLSIPVHEYWSIPAGAEGSGAVRPIPDYARNLPTPGPVADSVLHPYGPRLSSRPYVADGRDQSTSEDRRGIASRTGPHWDYEVCEVVAVHDGSLFRFAISVRDARIVGRSYEVNVASTHIGSRGSIAMASDPSRGAVRTLETTHALDELETDLLSSGWLRFQIEGRHWFSSRFHRSKL